MSDPTKTFEGSRDNIVMRGIGIVASLFLIFLLVSALGCAAVVCEPMVPAVQCKEVP